MLSRPNLEISLEEVMSNDFCVLTDSDLVSEAQLLVTIQSAREILILDSEGKFAGIVRDISVLSEMPPQVEDVPIKYRIKNPHLRKQITDCVVSTGKRNIGEVFKLAKPTRIFYKTQSFSAALTELARLYKYYTVPRVIPILNEDKTIAGILTYREVLEYIKNDNFLLEAKVKEFFSEKIPKEQIYTLLPDDTLAQADMAMEYLPIDYILICDSNSHILGMVNRIQVSALVHHLYPELINMPLREIMKSVGSLEPFDSSQPIKEIISSFLELGIGAVIAVNKTASQERPRGILTPWNVIQLFLLSFGFNSK
jgi:predicted transcriptional regulator